MIDRILARLRPDPIETPMPPEDARHAIGALLVRMAHADRAYLFEEVETIDRILARREGLNPVEAAQMRARCEKLAEAMPSTETLVTLIRDNVELAEREAMFSALCEVMLADGVRDHREENLGAEAGALLGLSPQQVARLSPPTAT